MDFKTNTLVLNVSFPEIVFRTDYEAEGAVFILPVNIATTFEGLLGELTFSKSRSIKTGIFFSKTYV